MSPTIQLPSRFATDQEQLAALRVPFPVSEVKTRDQGGTPLHYYDGYTINQRLLDVLGTGFSVRTGAVRESEDRIEMETILEVEWLSGKRSQVAGWGSADVLRSKTTGKFSNDPYKSAHTDSIKVAASKLGLGAELYSAQYRLSIAPKLEEMRRRAEEGKIYTCQAKGCEIIDAEVGGKVYSRDSIIKSSRSRFNMKLCAECATEAAKKAQAVMDADAPEY